jgi:hypothetical protein
VALGKNLSGSEKGGLEVDVRSPNSQGTKGNLVHAKCQEMRQAQKRSANPYHQVQLVLGRRHLWKRRQKTATIGAL